MKPGVRYIVTKPSDDFTFEVGDHIKLLADGCIECKEAQGWITSQDVPEATKGMEYEVDHEWIERRKAKLLKELEELK